MNQVHSSKTELGQFSFVAVSYCLNYCQTHRHKLFYRLYHRNSASDFIFISNFNSFISDSPFLNSPMFSVNLLRVSVLFLLSFSFLEGCNPWIKFVKAGLSQYSVPTDCPAGRWWRDVTEMRIFFMKVGDQSLHRKKEKNSIRLVITKTFKWSHDASLLLCLDLPGTTRRLLQAASSSKLGVFPRHIKAALRCVLVGV